MADPVGIEALEGVATGTGASVGTAGPPVLREDVEDLLRAERCRWEAALDEVRRELEEHQDSVSSLPSTTLGIHCSSCSLGTDSYLREEFDEHKAQVAAVQSSFREVRVELAAVRSTFAKQLAQTDALLRETSREVSFLRDRVDCHVASSSEGVALASGSQLPAAHAVARQIAVEVAACEGRLRAELELMRNRLESDCMGRSTDLLSRLEAHIRQSVRAAFEECSPRRHELSPAPAPPTLAGPLPRPPPSAASSTVTAAPISTCCPEPSQQGPVPPPPLPGPGQEDYDSMRLLVESWHMQLRLARDEVARLEAFGGGDRACHAAAVEEARRHAEDLMAAVGERVARLQEAFQQHRPTCDDCGGGAGALGATERSPLEDEIRQLRHRLERIAAGPAGAGAGAAAVCENADGGAASPACGGAGGAAVGSPGGAPSDDGAPERLNVAQRQFEDEMFNLVRDVVQMGPQGQDDAKHARPLEGPPLTARLVEGSSAGHAGARTPTRLGEPGYAFAAQVAALPLQTAIVAGLVPLRHSRSGHVMRLPGPHPASLVRASVASAGVLCSPRASAQGTAAVGHHHPVQLLRALSPRAAASVRRPSPPCMMRSTDKLKL